MARTRRRKKRTHAPASEDPAKKGPPKSFVFWRGQHGTILKGLESDLRKVMEPNTATNLKESKRNQLKDFVSVAGPLGISQFLILTATENSCYLRIAKTPRGPTLTMRIHHYSLIREVVAAQRRPRQPDSLWKTSPLVVMNNFVGQDQLKLATALFQNLFPAINVQTAKLSACQRVVLLSYNKGTNKISFRHYSILAQPCGVTKGVKALINKRQIPNLGNFQDISDFVTKSGYGSESEGEDAAEGRVTLAQDMGRGNHASRQSRIRLQEIGPRMELEIVKAEEGLCTGQVLYHQHISKPAAEVVKKTRDIKDQEELREKRRKQQEENVRRKEALKRKAEPGQSGKAAEGNKRRKKEWWDKTDTQRPVEEDDDVEHYRKEVGEDPDDIYGLSSKAGRGVGGRKGTKPGKGLIKERNKGRDNNAGKARSLTAKGNLHKAKSSDRKTGKKQLHQQGVKAKRK